MLFIAIFSKSDEKMAKVTEVCLKSIASSELPAAGPFSSIQTCVIESGESTQYACDKTLLYGNAHFNYNHACNIALEEGLRASSSDDDWLCFMNNDMAFDRRWILELDAASKAAPQIGSMCPDIGLLKDLDYNAAVILGYVLKKTFNGCCFMMKASVAKKLGKFDEQFDFYFQDDDLLEWLRTNGIVHGIVLKAKAVHFGQMTTGTEDIDKLLDGAKKFIRKHSFTTYLQREAEKCAQLKTA